MVQALSHFKETPSQTAGPYVHIGCAPHWTGIAGVYLRDLGAPMVLPETQGERITVKGHVIDGSGTPLKDALVEIWQADFKGAYNSPHDRRKAADLHFSGWGRCPTDGSTGEFTFETIKPGRVPFKDGRLMAPHITFWIVARGINLGLHTRMYFSDEENANAEDPVLLRIEHRIRVPTLIAKKDQEHDKVSVYTFDIHLQGELETVFFDI